MKKLNPVEIVPPPIQLQMTQGYRIDSSSDHQAMIHLLRSARVKSLL
jgi:hypothetical protein